MSILLAQETAIAPTSGINLTELQSQSQKEHLVAHWLRDDNNRLYCQWVKEYPEQTPSRKR